MCVAENNPRRRHRAAYLAPSTRFESPNTEENLPAPPTTGPPPGLITPPLMGGQEDDGLSLEERFFLSPPSSIPIETQSPWVTFTSFLYDLLMLIVVSIVSFFFYDVEVSIVKTDVDLPLRRHDDIMGSNRVVLRSDLQLPEVLPQQAERPSSPVESV